VFYFSRITWRAFKSAPQSPAMAQAAQLEKWGSTQTDSSSVHSNVYSTPEALLLKWLTVHYNHRYGKAQPDRREERRGRGDDSGYVRLMNFDQDLRDCKAFLAVLAGYIPALAAKFEGDPRFYPQPQGNHEKESNAGLFLDELNKNGMECRASARDIVVDYSARDLLLLSAYLYHALPQHIPKTTIKFRGKLHEPIVKQIELTNPTKHTIDYAVRIEPDDAKLFTANKQFQLKPKETGQFTVQIIPRFVRKAEGRITFLSGRGGAFSAATMVFNLETDVDPESVMQPVLNIESPMYELNQFELSVDNPFNQAGHFSVTILQEYMRGQNPKPMAEEESIHHFPEAFYCSDQINLKKKAGKDDRQKHTVQFMPCVRGKYKARIVFRNESIGEFAYLVYGTCTPPKPFEAPHTIQTEANQPVAKEFQITSRHAAFDKAMAQKDERFKGLAGLRRGKSSTTKDDVDGREVTYKVEFLNDRYQGPNPFFSGPKTFTLRPAQVDEDDGGGKRKKDTKLEKGAVQTSTLPITFNPKGPGTYNCYVMLVSNWDVRVLHIEGKARAPGMKAELNFACPARQVITQDIPITNGSDKEWVVAAAVSGENFSGAREIRVPAGKTRNYTLTFSPPWVCDVTGSLILKNNDTGEKCTYTLKAHAEEPLAERTEVINCRARETTTVPISVPNHGFEEVTYTVETDLPFVAGEPKLTVPKSDRKDYILHLSPQLGVPTTGSITFYTPQRQYVWFVLQVNVKRPPPEDKITVSCEVRKGVVAEIGIHNPTDKAIDFVVRRRGEGLLGEDVVSLDPQQKSMYQLAFAPTKAGEYDGIVSFNNDDVGEFWYQLRLVAKEAAPTPLSFQCELGKTVSTEVVLDNPTDQECIMTLANTNTENFTIAPQNLVLKPNQSLRVTLTYMPSAIQTPQDAVVKISHPRAGQWEFRCKGVGLPPTKMENITCVAQVSRTSSAFVTFRNPFPIPKRFLATLKTAEGEDGAAPVFALMNKKQSPALPPFDTLKIPISYTPTVIAQHRATVVVQLLEQKESDLRWEFPILGIAEHTFTDAPYKLSCRARKETTQVFMLPLVGLVTSVADEEFTAELVVGRETQYRRAAVNSLSVSRSTKDKYQGKEANYNFPCIYFEFVFAPLRPFSITAELLVRKASGGMWRFPVQLDATYPETDETITIPAAVNVVETVAIHLYNVLPEPRAFVAYFSPDSPQEFSVNPTKGVLPPMPSSVLEQRGSGQEIDVSFQSSQYGKSLTGTLIVETEDMQWRYEVRGTLPPYKPPTGVKSRVNNRLRAETETKLGRRGGDVPGAAHSAGGGGAGIDPLAAPAPPPAVRAGSTGRVVR